jgi:hypothetical protein
MLKTASAWRKRSFITTVFVAAMDRENSPYDQRSSEACRPRVDKVRENSPYDQRSSEACRPRVDKVMWHPEFWKVWKDAKSSS